MYNLVLDFQTMIETSSRISIVTRKQIYLNFFEVTINFIIIFIFIKKSQKGVTSTIRKNGILNEQYIW